MQHPLRVRALWSRGTPASEPAAPRSREGVQGRPSALCNRHRWPPVLPAGCEVCRFSHPTRLGLQPNQLKARPLLSPNLKSHAAAFGEWRGPARVNAKTPCPIGDWFALVWQHLRHRSGAAAASARAHAGDPARLDRRSCVAQTPSRACAYRVATGPTGTRAWSLSAIS